MIRLPDSEWIAFEAGLKPALRTTVAETEAERLAARARDKGFAVVTAGRPVQLPGRPAEVVLYLARNAAHAQAMREAEAPVLPGTPPRPPDDEVFSAHARLGELLGFPRCCVAAFLTRLRRGVTLRPSGGHAHEDFVAVEDALSRTREPLGRLANLSAERTARLISFYPCRYDCDVAAAFALAAMGAVARVAPDGAAALRAALLAPASIATDGTRSPDAATLAGETLTLAPRRL